MPWRVGLDEAGYGPNLGPLVMASSACHVPADGPPCLWKALRPAVRKDRHKDNGRLLIDDSKKVNQGPGGLAKLEAGREDRPERVQMAASSGHGGGGHNHGGGGHSH